MGNKAEINPEKELITGLEIIAEEIEKMKLC